MTLTAPIARAQSRGGERVTMSHDAAHTQQAQQADTLLPDTLILPGRQSFTTYERPGLCVAAALGVQRVATRAQYDTLTYDPDHDTVTTVAVNVARRCMARFTIETVPTSELLAFLHLALLGGNDSLAQVVTEHYIASVPDPAQRRWALYAVDTTYLNAKPMRRKAAEAITARLDSLGGIAALQRFKAHFKLGEDADRRYVDVQRTEQEAAATLSAYMQIPLEDRNDMDARGPINAMGWVFAIELYRSPDSAIARTEALARKAGFTQTGAFDAIMHSLRFDWAIQQFGTQIPPLTAKYWVNPDSSQHRWPVPGKISLYLHGNRDFPPEAYALWKRLGAKYGNKLDITVLERTQGYFRGEGDPPLSGLQEADRLGAFYRDQLGLPVTVAVEESPQQQLPDGRRLMGRTPLSSDAYYSMGFIMTDQAGHIILLNPGGVTSESEALLNAWISRAISQQHPSSVVQSQPPRIPRLWDRRMGPWYKTQTGYLIRQRIIRRDPTGPSSEVVRPIVYTIDSTVPRQWVPWIRRGIEAWLPAFDQTGFRHALVVRDGVTAPEGLRMSVASSSVTAEMPGCIVTWSAVSQDGAMTALSVDDTTGDITACTIELNDGLVDMLQRYAFLYLGATNPLMRYPHPDSIVGRFLQLAVSHETGHSLGFGENLKAGMLYPTDSLHSTFFVHRFGHTPSVMGYVFFDAVAQVADKIPFEDLIGRVGPRDVWSLGLAYRPVPGAKSPAQELSRLEQWRAVQDTDFLMHVTTSTPNEGGADAYLIGNDLVASATAIAQNLALTVPQIDSQAALAAPLDSAAASALAACLRSMVLNIWAEAIAAAGDVVGGIIPLRPYPRDAMRQQTQPMDSAQQIRSLRFALAHLMYGQDPLVQVLFGRAAQDTSLMLFATAAHGWSIDEWQSLQQSMLAHLLRHWLPRVVEQENTTHVLPVWCRAIRRLHGALQTTQAEAAHSEGRQQAEVLLTQLRPALEKGCQ